MYKIKIFYINILFSWFLLQMMAFKMTLMYSLFIEVTCAGLLKYVERYFADAYLLGSFFCTNYVLFNYFDTVFYEYSVHWKWNIFSFDFFILFYVQYFMNYKENIILVKALVLWMYGYKVTYSFTWYMFSWYACNLSPHPWKYY